ncbi:putative disease resistance protein RGA4 [Bienertia sinuspersici]
MEIVGTSLSAAQTLLKALQCPQLKNILEIIGYESQLEDLKHTVEAVTAVLRDAEKKIDLSEHTQFLIEELKDAVFEADDLLDEFVTLAEQNRVLKVEGRLSEKVRSFFSGSNPLGVAYRMSRGVKKIRKKLDAIAYNKQGMGKMTNLERLIGWYVLGGEGRCSSWKEWFYGVEDLKTLSSLKEQLKIKIMWPKKVENNHVCKHDHWSWREGLNLNSSVKHLNSIILDFQDHKENDGIITRLMEELQPHPNLKKLVVLGYNGVKMPSWANPTSLPHLAKLYLDNCEVLEYLPLFPSLKVLELENMPKLKGVLVEESSSSSNDSNPQFQQSLPCLSKLDIRLCPELICILHCPRLKFLHLWCEVERIRIICPKVKKVTVDKMAWLNLTPIETLKSIRYLDITINYEVEYLPSCIQCLSSLQILIIHDCACLEAMPNWMPKLASLRKFQVFNCSDSMWTRCQQNPPGMYWPYIQHIPYINILSRTGKSLKHQREVCTSNSSIIFL